MKKKRGIKPTTVDPCTLESSGRTDKEIRQLGRTNISSRSGKGHIEAMTSSSPSSSSSSSSSSRAYASQIVSGGNDERNDEKGCVIIMFFPFPSFLPFIFLLYFLDLLPSSFSYARQRVSGGNEERRDDRC